MKRLITILIGLLLITSAFGQTKVNKRMTLSDYHKGIFVPLSTGTVADTIPASMLSRIMYYNEAAATDLTATANCHQIVAGTNGQIITIVGSSDVNTLTLEDGFGLQLAGAAACVLGSGDNITLLYITALSVWIEIDRSDN